MKETRLFQYLSKLFRGEECEAPLDNPEAFDALYEQSYRHVYRYLFGLHGSHSRTC